MVFESIVGYFYIECLVERQLEFEAEKDLSAL